MSDPDDAADAADADREAILDALAEVDLGADRDALADYDDDTLALLARAVLLGNADATDLAERGVY